MNTCFVAASWQSVANFLATFAALCRDAATLLWPRHVPFVAFVLFVVSATTPAAEKLDRGFVAIATKTNRVYLSWRLLPEDAKDAAFNIYRVGYGEPPKRLNAEPIGRTTDFTDTDVTPKRLFSWQLKAVVGGVEQPKVIATVSVAATPKPYRSIPLQGTNTLFDKVALCDLNGDGALDFVIKQPRQITDPGVWTKSEDTFKVEAYQSDGTFLWRKDLGWNIEQGVWWSPMIACDFDGDGKAEVALKTAPMDKDYRNEAGRVLAGPEYCSVLDGLTGKELSRVDWPARGNIADWGDTKGNRASRHLIGMAHLDGVGKNPSLLVMRGTYTLMRVDAYDFAGGKLKLRWSWSGDDESPQVRGQGMHGMHAADVDGDGRDEIILGAAVLDDNGKIFWNLGMGHPDAVYVTDIDPARPGLEIIYGFESAQPTNGFCLVEARTGKIIWGSQHITAHIHSQGMYADIDPANPGPEFFGGEKFFPDRWLYSARDGKLLSREDLGSLSPNPVYWDDTPFKAYLKQGTIVKHGGAELGAIEGRVVAVGDLLGDWREEFVTSVPGEIRIYTTTIPATSRRVTALADRLYRTDVALQSMGYLYPPQLSFYPYAKNPQ
jgi:rhamnogalacturonan endolyase